MRGTRRSLGTHRDQASALQAAARWKSAYMPASYQIEDASLDLETGLNSIDAVRARDPMNPVKGFIKA